MLSSEHIIGNWKEFKGGVRNLWGEISEEELDKTRGNISQIKELVQAKYQETPEEIQEKMERLLDSFDNDTDKFLSPDVSSYQRSPVETETRTSAKSQNQDQSQDVATRSAERSQFEKKKFEEGRDSIH